MTVITPSTVPPAPLSAFIGRERELAELAGLLASPVVRLLTLTGAGGCGKTRLALTLAERVTAAGAFEHGACRVALAGLAAHELVAPAVAAALGLPEARDQSRLEVLGDFLQDKEMLIVLDNCEHLLPACADLAGALLSLGPRLRLLVTSREPLGLPSETVWLVPSLALPDPQAATSLLLQAESVRLFAARAQAALPGFELTADNAAAVAHICRQLDGMPLAIELAAARVKLLAVEQIAARLADGLQLLTHGSRIAAPRHQTMRAALDWSYGLLAPRAKCLFQRLAVFASGFTLDAAERVGADPREPEIEPGDVLDLLSDLVDKSMVSVAERPAHAPVRYRLLEPIRQYALERLRETAEPGAEAAARDRHLAYFAGFAEQAAGQLKTARQLDWLRRLDQEYDNLRAALAWSDQAPTRAAAELRLAAALYRYWYQRAYLHEGRRWLALAMAHYDAQAGEREPEAERWLARALIADGWLSITQGDYHAPPVGLERGLALARALDDPLAETEAAGALGLLSGYRGDREGARAYSLATLASARRSGEAWSLALALHLHGLHCYYHLKQAAEARRALADSAALFEQVGDRRWYAVVMNLRATLAANDGELAAAQHLYEAALAIAQELDDQELRYKERYNLGGLAVVQGELDRAEALYTQALAEARRHGARLWTGESLQGLAEVHLLRGELATAEPLLRESLGQLQGVGHAGAQVRLLAKFAHLAAARGHGALAAQALGAVQAALTHRNMLMDTDDRLPVERHRAWVQRAMPPAEFEQAFAAGAKLTLEQAMETVLAGLASGGHAQPAPATSPRPALRLFGLGPARALASGPIVWPYARVKELLFYLASTPPRTKAQIGLALWPEASGAQLRSGLGTTLYHLRQALGRPEWIVFEDDHYSFNRTLGAEYDVDEFEAGLAQAARLQARAPEQALALLAAALERYQGEFVEDLLEGEWFRLRREALRRKYLDGLLDLGLLYFARGDYAAAAEAYRRAVEKENVLESAHRALMRCYERLGEHGQALRHYQTLQQVMQAELGTPPAAESLALYEQLRRGVAV